MFLKLAGPSPARGELDQWRQVALLGVSAATSESPLSRRGLAAALLARDFPVEAGRILSTLDADDPWTRWWMVQAVGQSGDRDALRASVAAAREKIRPRGADGRDVARRLADLQCELAALDDHEGDDARFSVLGHRARPERRALIGGRSSAVFLIDPEWEALRLVRLGPSDGPSSGNAALFGFVEVLEAVRRGEAGPGRHVPNDAPAPLAPQPMLDALREDPATRDARLLALATEVQDERKELARERARLAEERSDLEAQQHRLRARVAAAANGSKAPPTPSRVSVPTTTKDAAALLGVAVGASRTTVQRHWRDLVASCHPDRVEGLHPGLRKHAGDLAVALNAARELLLNGGSTRPRRG